MEDEGAGEVGQTHGYNLRGARDRDYSHRFEHNMDQPHSSKSYDAHVQLLQQALQDVHMDVTDAHRYIVDDLHNIIIFEYVHYF